MIAYDPGNGGFASASVFSNGTLYQFDFNVGVGSTSTVPYDFGNFVNIENCEYGRMHEPTRKPKPWLMLSRAQPFKTGIRPMRQRARFLDREFLTKTRNRRF